MAMLKYEKLSEIIQDDIAECDDIKICSNLEYYNKPLPTYDGWFTPTLKWRIMLNLILQCCKHNNVKLWMDHNDEPGLAFHEITDPQMIEEMIKICVKISCGYCARAETEILINIPISLKRLIGKKYLFVQPAIFKDFHCNGITKADSPKWCANRYHRPCRSEDGKMMDVNPYPPTDSLILESIPSLSGSDSD